jgi:hypothetical protein
LVPVGLLGVKEITGVELVVRKVVVCWCGSTGDVGGGSSVVVE